MVLTARKSLLIVATQRKTIDSKGVITARMFSAPAQLCRLCTAAYPAEATLHSVL
jgi:hypothetical protein